MSRMIDADALMELYADSKDFSLAMCNVPIPIIRQNILDMPTIDAAPVVRCRECKHHREKNKQEKQYLVEDILICTSPYVTDDCWSAVWPDHFCSYGEKKEGTGNEA